MKFFKNGSLSPSFEIAWKSIIILTTFAFLKTGESAQPVYFWHLSINDGLSQNGVFSIIQDQKGFMRVGTKDGLNRNDRYTFKGFPHKSFNSVAFSKSNITFLFDIRNGLGRNN